MTLVVGVDGGGTRIRAVVVDEHEVELARAEGTGAVVTASGAEAVVRAVSGTVRAAAEAAGITLPVARLWAGLAGAGSGKRNRELQLGLGRAGLAAHVVVGTDVQAAFHDAFGVGPGLLLIAGTGSIACGRGERGEVVRVGGWGDRLGDEGSGYAIGLAALTSALRDHDGRGEPSALTTALPETLGLAGPEDLVDWCGAASKGEVAALVPSVVAAAEAGDAPAQGILVRAVSALEEHLRAALERTGPWAEPPELALWGGLLQQGGTLRAAMERSVGAHPVRLSGRSLDPALGAARLALAATPGAP